jgi:hypothetical protein
LQFDLFFNSKGYLSKFKFSGTKLPGPGCIYMGQTFKFVKPAYLNEEIEATVELIRARKEKKIFFLKLFVEMKRMRFCCLEKQLCMHQIVNLKRNKKIFKIFTFSVGLVKFNGIVLFYF